MVVPKQTNSRLLEEVGRIYAWLDSEIGGDGDLAGACRACGACCDFESFEHQLFITTAELMYLAAKIGTENIKPMTTGRCPYNIDGRCGIYGDRFAGCRIFFCKSDKDFQSRLSEAVSKRLKAACVEWEIRYRYAELSTALNDFFKGSSNNCF